MFCLQIIGLIFVFDTNIECVHQHLILNAHSLLAKIFI